jgi:hypothetical protein
MVEIQVAVEDPARLKALLAGLTGLLDRSSLAFDGDRNELCVSAEWDPWDVDEVIGAFETWLAADGLGASATLCIGDAAYEITGSSAGAEMSEGFVRRPAPAVAATPNGRHPRG